MIARCRAVGIKNTLIRWWIRRFDVSLDQAKIKEIDDYQSFNDFFTRALEEEARPMPENLDIIVSPVDGAVSQAGKISSGRIFQAKGFDFSTSQLLGGDEQLAARFEEGAFATFYLSPGDYHRVHMPCHATLEKMIYIPGRLFSVNAMTAKQVPGLYARNERVACLFDTDHGPMAMVLVGAMLVAGIETVWAGDVAPLRRKIIRQDYRMNAPIALKRGEEMGRFKLGSTVIVLFGKDAVSWEQNCMAGACVEMGQAIALPSGRFS